MKPTPDELEDAGFHYLDIEVYKEHRQQGVEHNRAIVLAMLTEALSL